jgi:hypothetical protein
VLNCFTSHCQVFELPREWWGYFVFSTFGFCRFCSTSYNKWILSTRDEGKRGSGAWARSRGMRVRRRCMRAEVVDAWVKGGQSGAQETGDGGAPVDLGCRRGAPAMTWSVIATSIVTAVRGGRGYSS